MALSTSKCNHLTPLHFKGLSKYIFVRIVLLDLSPTSPSPSNGLPRCGRSGACIGFVDLENLQSKAEQTTKRSPPKFTASDKHGLSIRHKTVRQSVGTRPCRMWHCRRSGRALGDITGVFTTTAWCNCGFEWLVYTADADEIKLSCLVCSCVPADNSTRQDKTVLSRVHTANADWSKMGRDETKLSRRRCEHNWRSDKTVLSRRRSSSRVRFNVPLDTV